MSWRKRGEFRNTPLLVVLAQWAQCRLCVCLMLTELWRVKIFSNVATQIAVYHLKYRVQSKEKGRKGHYALVAKDLSLFSFYSMPTNGLLKDNVGNSPLSLFEDCFISTTCGVESKLCTCSNCQGLLVPTGCPHPMTLRSLLRQLNFVVVFSLYWVETLKEILLLKLAS